MSYFTIYPFNVDDSWSISDILPADSGLISEIFQLILAITHRLNIERF